MVLKSDANDLFALLLHLKSAWSAICAATETGSPLAAETDRLKHAALVLYQAVGRACDRGQTVRLHSTRGGGRTHLVRTLGPLNPDGITFQYSPDRDADKTLNHCALPAMQWIDSSADPHSSN